MHFYTFNIADYRKDTGHLCAVEHYIYRSLLDTYYLNEKPISLDISNVMRTHCLRTADDERMLKNVLQDFFVCTENGYEHKRVSAEISAYKAKSEVAKRSAESRWSKKTSGIDANALQTDCDSNANQEPRTNNQEPITNIKDIKGNKLPLCPYEKIIEAYHNKLSCLPSIKSLTDARRKKINSLWVFLLTKKRIDGTAYATNEQEALLKFEQYFDMVGQSDFLSGRVESNRTWQCNIDFLIEQKNFIKIIEGAYSNKKGTE